MDIPGFEEDEMTALYDADMPRVDLVGKGANGIPRFLIAKQGADSAGLVPAGYVRDLISKEAPVTAPAEPGETTLANGIVIKGSPAAMAAFIHAASEREVAKAEKSAKSINDLPDSDFAYIEPGGKKDDEGKTTPRSLRHFPVMDAAHVRNALSRAPQSPFGDKAMPAIRAAARRFKIDVAKEADVTQVAKDMGPELDGDPDVMDALDVTMPLAEPEDDMPGDPAEPGSPAWEAIDAATAQKWLSVAARLKNALCVLAEREMLEAAVADPDDAEHAWDLEDAKCAVEYAIEQLAVFAAGEQIEAELGAEMADIGKAVTGSEAPLAVIEGLTAVAKAGRVLSAANEAAIRAASESLQNVLASLPEAPVAKEAVMAEDKAADVAKETASPDAQARDSGPVNAGGTTGMGEPRHTGPDAALPGDGPQAARPGDVPGRTVVKASALKVLVYDRAGREHRVLPSQIFEPVTKADGDSEDKPKMQAVFDQDGDLIGVVDPDAITPVAGAAAPAPGSDGDGEPQPGPAAAAGDGDMTPQPPADAGTPAEDVAKGAVDTITIGRQVLESTVAKAVTDALATQSAAHAEVVAKMAADGAGQAEEIAALKARLETVENTPAAPKVFANGQVPPAHQMRGQDQGALAPVDVAKAAELKTTLYRGTAAEQNDAFHEMQQLAVDRLAAMRR